MLHSVPLNHLPLNVQFPTHLLGKVSFDPLAKQLRFQGFMSKGDFDRLSSLSNDLEYLRALEQLFQLCEYAPENSASPLPWLKIGLGVSIMLMLAVGIGLLVANAPRAKLPGDEKARLSSPELQSPRNR